MVAHRDYMNSGDSSVKIYDSFIEFFNPGKLPDDITVDGTKKVEKALQESNNRIPYTIYGSNETTD